MKHRPSRSSPSFSNTTEWPKQNLKSPSVVYPSAANVAPVPPSPSPAAPTTTSHLSYFQRAWFDRTFGRSCDDACTIHGMADADTDLGYGGYEWGYAFVISVGDRFYCVSGEGCSCESPADDCHTVAGPAATLGGLFDELYVNLNTKSKSPPKLARLAFVNAIERLNAETLSSTRTALQVAPEEK